MLFDRHSLENLEKRYRTRLINSLSGFKSANLVGTQDSQGHTNLSIVSSVVHLGSHPPLMGLIFRPNTVPRHTFENLRDSGYFTINQVTSEFYQAAHQTSARYPREVCEFHQTGLTAEYLNQFNAPFVAQSPVKYGLKVVEIQSITANNTELVVGEVLLLDVNQNALKQDGYLDLEAVNTVAVSGLDSYHTTSRLNRLSYAKPNTQLTHLTIDGAANDNIYPNSH